MTTSRPGRTATLVLAYLGLAPLAGIWTMFGFIMATTRGASQMAAIVPIMLFVFTGWIWSVLAIIALARAARAPRPGHPVAVALLALVLAVSGLIFLLPQ